MKLARRLVVLLLAALAARGVPSGLPVVPTDVQLAVFLNVWKLDRNFRSPARMVVLYQENHHPSVAVKNEVMATIAAKKMPIQCIALAAETPEQLEKVLAEIDANVIYVAPVRALDVSAIATHARKRHIRTITGVPEYVEAGLGVGIGLRKNRPLIIVNLSASRAEGADFAAQLLGLARIVGPIR